MQVTVEQELTAIHRCQLLTYRAGDVVRGDIAAYLLRSGAAVTPSDADADALATVEQNDGAAAARALLDAGITPTQASAIADDADEIVSVAPGDIDIAASTIDQVLAWVGDDSDRALAAHASEEARGDKARSTLLSKLAEIGLD